jgi:hypothetical protein
MWGQTLPSNACCCGIKRAALGGLTHAVSHADLRSLLRRAALRLRNTDSLGLDDETDQAIDFLAVELSTARPEVIRTILVDWLIRTGRYPSTHWTRRVRAKALRDVVLLSRRARGRASLRHHIRSYSCRGALAVAYMNRPKNGFAPGDPPARLPARRDHPYEGSGVPGPQVT